MFVASSKFVVANGMEAEVCEAFCNRPHLVDHAPGFVRMEVMNPIEKPEEFLLVTYWQNQESWQQWYKGHTYKDSHKGIPKGLKLVPATTEIKLYNLFSE
jgi:heme-degrading monooxygenase HmoA